VGKRESNLFLQGINAAAAAVVVVVVVVVQLARLDKEGKNNSKRLLHS
jgi:hypothetical protein